MPNYSESLISNARAAMDASSNVNAQQALVILASRAIAAACGTGAYTCSISVSGASSVNLQFLLEVLHTCGYFTQISGTTLTITWTS
jgi:predicted hotdog family 3-hydroxylacyl-ACP dehydratase